MTYTDIRRRPRRARTVAAMALTLVLAGCGDLGSAQLAPGQFRVYAFGTYAHDADLQREAVRVCPHGFTVTGQSEMDGPSDYKSTLLLDVKCNENSNQ